MGIEVKYAALQPESSLLPFLLGLATKQLALCVHMSVHVSLLYIYIKRGVYIYMQIPVNTLLLGYCKQVDNPSQKGVNNMGKHQS